MDPTPGRWGPFWTPITPEAGSLFHAAQHPRGIAQGEMPPLFVMGAEGSTELVNYRAYRNVLIVDRLFAAAELRLGGENQQKVRIVRSDGRSM